MAGGALEQRVALPCGQRRKIRGVAFDKGPEESLQRQVQMREVKRKARSVGFRRRSGDRKS